MTVACCYKSTRKNGETEWRRARVVNRLNFRGDIEVFLFDHGYYITTTIDKIRRLFKPFGEMPRLSVKAKLAGLLPFFQNWSNQETDHFKSVILKAEKTKMLGMVAKRTEVSHFTISIYLPSPIIL